MLTLLKIGQGHHRVMLYIYNCSTGVIDFDEIGLSVLEEKIF